VLKWITDSAPSPVKYGLLLCLIVWLGARYVRWLRSPERAAEGRTIPLPPRDEVFK
jgi:hypothetical protein